VIGLDTNILIYSHRRDSPWFSAADREVRSLVSGDQRWGLPWPCVHEFFGVVTHPRVYSPPSLITEALAQIEAWLNSPSVSLLHESALYWETLRPLLVEGHITGPRVHDAKIAALCEVYGISELWSADRDFNRFPGVRVRNPLVG